MFKILSTFSGAGGLDIGFNGDFYFLNNYYKKLNFETKVAVDINKDACHTLKYNKKYFENTNVLNSDITKLNIDDIPKDNYDVLIGGFPCVTFSVVGKQLGVEDSINGRLYETFAKYVEHFRPKIFIAENVKGILSANKGKAVEIIKKRFKDTGYNLKVELINFANYGVPQNRERVIFIGIKDDIDIEFNLPKSTVDKPITTKEAFNGLNDNLANMNYMKTTQQVIEKLKNIPEGGNFKDLPSHLAVKGLMSNIYRRLDRNKPAYTVIASGGGGTWTYHYKYPRPLTNRERARLQGFPDDLVFCGSNSEVRRQIGNAVPPVGIYHIAKEIETILKNFYTKKVKKVS